MVSSERQTNLARVAIKYGASASSEQQQYLCYGKYESSDMPSS
jgi:hypothetical protein